MDPVTIYCGYEAALEHALLLRCIERVGKFLKSRLSLCEMKCMFSKECMTREEVCPVKEVAVPIAYRGARFFFAMHVWKLETQVAVLAT
ncbi:hypothetical protein NDU88_000563 [Pleurodeles waltl]|uniref:Uncharacterized protein n=1 Tax=Pleurodeles waltl TaxID=8319 RepID=A0AAV7URF6_PLEWA|nr:hypothetical protein NDU88_000563 [Pleurodeles waltl]